MRVPTVARHGSQPVLVWHFAAARRTISSAAVGGGIGERQWICNAQVARDYARTDLAAHIDEVAVATGCEGSGIGMLTAADVQRFSCATDRDVDVFATVGLSHPTWAADRDDAVSAWAPGTINVVAFVPHPLTDDALVNAVMTTTEAKTQALIEAGIPGTGTASDAVCIACDPAGPVERFAGPRSAIGASLARAVRAAVQGGIR